MIKYLSIARRIHRFLVLILTNFSLIMAFTSLFLKYPFISSHLNFLNLGMMRYVHNQLSPWLTITLLLMAFPVFCFIFLLGQENLKKIKLFEDEKKFLIISKIFF